MDASTLAKVKKTTITHLLLIGVDGAEPFTTRALNFFGVVLPREVGA